MNPVGVAVVGAGKPNIATSNHLPAMQDLESVRLVALCDIRADGVRQYAQEYRVDAYTDYRAMLKRPDIEMVQVATPDWVHAEQAIEALEAGKHVLVQKPMCLRPEQLAGMVRAARHNGRLLQCLLAGRWTAPVQRIKSAVDAGQIGHLRHVEIRTIGRRFPIMDSQSPYLKAEGGGVWLHNGPHFVDEAMFVLESVPVRVSMESARNPCGAAEYLGETDNYYLAHIDFAGGQTFTFEYNTALLQDGLPSGIDRVYLGTRGEIRQRLGSSHLELTCVGSPEVKRIPAVYDRADSIGAFRAAIDQFARAIRTKKETSPTLDESVRLMHTLWGALESARSGQPLELTRQRISM